MDSSTNPVGEEAVRAELNRILASRKLSPSQAKLLSHVVDRSLHGDVAALKESLLGIEVFDRHADFDPRMDPIVRVQAAKLRGRLADYYAGPGARSPVVIEMPRGGYAPVFRPRGPEPARKKTMPLQWILTAAGVPLTIAALLGIYLWTGWFAQSPPPSLASLRQVTFDMEISTFPSISPDGRWIVFSADEGGRSFLNLFVMPSGGGKAIRLTSTPAADITPDFSPDGETIVFRSNRGQGGIYRIPAHGGAETLVAERGWNPRFSPDGKWIVYTGESGRPGGDLFVVAADPVKDASSLPRMLPAGNLHISGIPLWTPDGSHILFVAWDDRAAGTSDWWSMPWSVDAGGAGAPKPSGILPALGVTAGAATSATWFQDHFIFGVRQGNSSSIWEARVEKTGVSFGKPRRLTFGTGLEGFPRVDRNGGMVFVSDHQPTHLWQFPVDWRNASITGPPRQLTNDSSLQPGGFVDPPRVGWAGEWLAFASTRSGNPDIWIRNLSTNQERQITANPWPESQPLLSRDARFVAYRASREGRQDILLSDTQSLSTRLLCSNCGIPACWTTDDRSLLAISESGDLIRRIQVDDGASEVILTSGDIPDGSKARLRHVDCDPAGQSLLLTFLDFPGSRGSVFLAGSISDLRNPASWKDLVPGDATIESAHFSGEGRSAVYLSTMDPGLSLRVSPLDRGQPGNSGKILLPFHAARQRPWSKWLAVGPDGVIIRLTESRSTLWIGRLS